MKFYLRAQLIRRIREGVIYRYCYGRTLENRFAPSQWETALLCTDVSHWLGTSLESALKICMWPLEIHMVRALVHWLKMNTKNPEQSSWTSSISVQSTGNVERASVEFQHHERSSWPDLSTFLAARSHGPNGISVPIRPLLPPDWVIKNTHSLTNFNPSSIS